MRATSTFTLRTALVAITALAVCAGAAESAVAAPTAARSATHRSLDHRVLATFRPNVQFAESLAQNRAGRLFASVTTFGKTANHGQIYRVTRTGAKSKFGPALDTGEGVLTGVAFDSAGALYVADATFAVSPAPGVFRVTASAVTRVLTLPKDVFPNGLVFHGAALYISDSAHGAIYRWNRHTQPAPVSLTTPWLVGKRLTPGGAVSGIGPNGLAVRQGRLYVAVSDAGTNQAGKPFGRLAAVKITSDGSPGPVHVVLRSPTLATVDGIAFTPSGALWMVTNGRFSRNGAALGGERLLTLTADGSLRVLAEDTRWLNYPTAVVVNRAGEERTLFVENGAFYGGTANILRVH